MVVGTHVSVGRVVGSVEVGGSSTGDEVGGGGGAVVFEGNVPLLVGPGGGTGGSEVGLGGVEVEETDTVGTSEVELCPGGGSMVEELVGTGVLSIVVPLEVGGGPVGRVELLVGGCSPGG
jgi:hypothetical protein